MSQTSGKEYKYAALKGHLATQRTEVVSMRFADIEAVIGSELPPSARKHRPWWSNNPSNSVITNEWLNAGYKTEQVDMGAEALVFRKISSSNPLTKKPRTPSTPDRIRPNTDAHPIMRLYGALKECITIAKDIDLTNPALQSLDENFDKKWDAKLSETHKGEGQ